jgi:hypothetical protein
MRVQIVEQSENRIRHPARRPGAKEERMRDEFGNLRNPAKMPEGHLDSDCKENPLFRQEFLGFQRSA